MENTLPYVATRVYYSTATGEAYPEAREFPKSRDGLEEAYQFVEGADDWEVSHGCEVVDSSYK